MQHLIIAKNTFYQALARIGTSFIGFLITIVIARTFGVLGYGDFTKVTSYVAMFYLIVDFGLNAIYLQYEKPNFKNLLYLRLLISFFVFVFLNIIALAFPYNPVLGSGFSQALRLGILVFSLGIFAQSIILSTAAIFQKSINYFSYMVGLVLGSVVSLAAVLIFAFLNYSIFFIFIALVIGSITSAIILLKLAKQKILPLFLDLKFAKDILIKSAPIGAMLIFNLVYFRADIILLSLLSSTTSVGIYGLSYKFFDFLIALPLFLSNAVYPFLIQAKGNNNKFFSVTKKYFFVFLLSSIVIIIPFWFISPLFSLIKEDFANSIIPFRILLISLPFFFTTSFLQWVLITLGKQKYLMLVYLFSTILNIVLNLILIPQFSYIASAWITVLSEGLVFVLLAAKIFSVRILLEKGKENYE